MMNVAVPFVFTAEDPSTVAPSRNTIAPVGVGIPPAVVAVKVRLCPSVAGLTLLERAVTVGVNWTVRVTGTDTADALSVSPENAAVS